jgi:signal transduction histidine kinase
LDREANAAAQSRERGEADIAALKGDVESLRQALDQFINGVSHDLRGPLDQVQSLVGLLLRRHKASLNEDAQVLCGYIETATERASQVLEAIQEYARISEPVHLQSVDTENILSAAVFSCDAALRRSGAKVSKEALPVIYADGRKLIRLFEELVGNAVKFRGPDPLAIHVTCAQQGEFVEFSVRDNGPGIPVNKSGTIFEPYKRLHGYDYPGTGMGLAICKRIVEMHGGKIWVQPGPAGGADFRFTLPVRAATQE